MKQQVDIQELLDRYWEGETTLEEERRLKDFFASENIPEQFRPFKPLFQVLKADQEVRYSDNNRTVTRRFGSVFKPFRLAAAAVAILLIAGLWWWNTGLDQEQTIAQVKNSPAPVSTEKSKVTAPASEISATMDSPRLVEAKPVFKRVFKKTRKAPKTVQEQPEPVVEDTYEDPEQALAEIKAVLALVSSKINRSKTTLGKGLQEVDHIDILVKKQKETSG